jgi:PKD repeat protein
MPSDYTYQLVSNGCGSVIPQGSDVCDYYIHNICTPAGIPKMTRITVTEVNVATGAKKILWTQDLQVPPCTTFKIDSMHKKYPATEKGSFRIEVQLANLRNPAEVSEVQSFTVNIGQGVLDASFKPEVTADTVKFTNMSVGATSYHWDFGDGQTQDCTHPCPSVTHTYKEDPKYSTKQYKVTLTVSAADGRKDTQSLTVNVSRKDKDAKAKEADKRS